MNENDAYIFDVEQPREWVFAGEPVWISGWFVSKVGAVFSDVRAVIAGTPYLGILGMPRPEIEQRHGRQTRLPHAGFLLRVNPPAGATELRLELRDAGHRWVEIWRTPIRVRRGAAQPTAYPLGLFPDHVHRLLQARRADPATDLAPLADSLVAESAAHSLDTLPNPPFYGALEKPALIGGTQSGKILVEGWLIHRTQPIVRIVGSTHPQMDNELAYGDLPRPDAGQLFPDHPTAARSHYRGLLDVDETAPGPVLVLLFAELADGTRQLVFARRFHLRACHVWEAPLPVFSQREFWRSALSLRSAIKRRGLSLGSFSEQWRAAQAARQIFRIEAPAVIPAHASQAGAYAAWVQADRLAPRLRTTLTAASARLAADGPRFLVLIDARDCTPLHLDQLIASLTAQFYDRWEAHFTGPLAPGAVTDRRCHYHAAPTGSDLIHALNAVAAQSTSELVTFIPGHARLSPDALLEIAERLVATPDLGLVYTDEDRMDDNGLRSEPDFKPDWSPALALSGLFPGQLAVVPRAQFLAAGSLRVSCEAVAWYDLLLRAATRLTTPQVAHIPLVCYHARASVPRTLDLTHPAYEQARAALAESMTHRGWPAAPFLPESGHHRRRRFHQLRWSAELLARFPVTIVIPTRDRLHLLQECVECLEATVNWDHVKLVIVDDHSRDSDAVRYLAQIQQRSDLRCRVVRNDDPYAPFNYSRLVNAALPHLDTPLVLHLNNDVNALEPGWLEAMVGWFMEADVGIVGAKLIYPDRSLNHTGIIVGPHGGLADTPWAKHPEAAVEPVWHAATREVSAVTGACLLTRVDLYRELGGFDEQDFGVAYNDVDYCLRVRARGLRVLYTPQAKLMHWGSATRGVTFDEAEHIAFIQRFPAYRDPYFSAHWRLEGTGVESRPDGPDRSARAGHLRLLLLTHNLNREGAPLFLLEYATWMIRTAGFEVSVLSAEDGPLRADFAQLGAPVSIVDAAALQQAQDIGTFNRQLTALGENIRWADIDLVVANTLFSFWGVLLARQAGRPSLFYIHESTSVFRCFEPRLALALHPLVHTALSEATRTLFLCAASRAYHADDDRGNFRLVPAWIQLTEIAAYRRAHDRAMLRHRHGFADDEIIIANIGTVCARKGQHVFLRAAELFNRQHRRGLRVRFVMIGARPGLYLDLLQRDLARLGLANVTVVPETPAVYEFFAAADMFVCTSYEESFPRVIMEAMAFRVPIVSTDVQGIADLIGQRQDGYLVKSGDAEGLARMMEVCLAKERSGKSLAPTAYSRLLRNHDHRLVLPRHVTLAREAVLAHAEELPPPLKA